MSDPILDIESSEQDVLVRELVQIVHGTKSYSITFGTRDEIESGQVYTATPGGRGELGVSEIGDGEREMTLTLPINHAFVKRYLQNFVPPGKITVTLRRLYKPSGDIEIAHAGEITSLSVNDENTEATFRVPTRANEAARRLLPVLSVGRACPYILYGPGCNVSRTGSGPGGLTHKITTTVLFVDGRDVRVDLLDTDRNGAWAKGGELVVMSGTATTERMSVRSQTDLNPGSSSVADLSLQMPIPGLAIGNTVEVYAGCDHTINENEGCNVKFGNKDNFGGLPALPSENQFRWSR